MATPFAADGSLDLDAARALAGYLVAHGSEGLVLAGTTGEGPTLNDREKLALFDAVLDEVGSEARIIANTGTNDTAHSVHLTREARQIGMHGFLAVTPYYNKPPQRAIVRHFQEVACMTDRPVIAYNIPSRVVVNIEPGTMDELAEIENLAGVKQAYADLDEARHIVDIGLTLYAGDDNLIFPFLELGGTGGICVHTHVWGPQTKEMVRRYKVGDVAGARALNDEMAPAFELLKIQTNPIPIKAAMNLLGHDLGGYRLPMLDPTDEELAQVRACLERGGVLQPV